MQIIDLTTQYIHSVVHQDNPDSYESSFPHLFEHYYRFWAPRGTYFYRDVKEIQRRRKRMVERLAFLENRFLSKGLVLDKLVTVLFVGRGTSNGHAFPFGEKWVVWLPVESYPSSFTIDVFASHEIGHALHYQKRPEFFFDTEEEKTNVFQTGGHRRNCHADFKIRVRDKRSTSTLGRLSSSRAVRQVV
jgi:hypothetical protein